MKRFIFSNCVAVLVIAVFPNAVFAQAAISGNAFNPAISLILDGKYAHYAHDPKDYGVSGFLLGDEATLTPRGFSLGESELAASANVDDRFYGQITLAIASLDTSTELAVEEAFVQTTSLPKGLTLKAGRFFSDIGYLNDKHAHAWDFVDQPLAYKALLANQYGDDGVQLRWVAPLDLLVEFGVEAFRGAKFPAAGATHGGVGAWTATVHAGGDVGGSHSWRAGISYLNADASARETTLPNSDVIEYTGSSKVWIADFVWKWAEHGNAKTRNFVVQGEYLHRKEIGNALDTSINYAVTLFPAPFAGPDARYDGVQNGFYLQAVYQFMPRWRAGVRYDRLSADNNGPALGVVIPLNDTHDPTRMTAMVDFSNSEFSRLRLQLAEDKSLPRSDTQLIFQYVMSLGAHGAHQF